MMKQTLVVHPGTGTIIDAEECFILQSDDFGGMDDGEIVEAALTEGHFPLHRNLYAVIYGNIIDGYGHYGPFWDFNDAQEWAERNTADENTWNIVVLRGA